ncbi:MAG: hypothetical protein EHM56_08940, partial [Chloroflexi bacterium]
MDISGPEQPLSRAPEPALTPAWPGAEPGNDAALKVAWRWDRLGQIARPLMPWSLFLLVLAWGWRVKDWFHTVPAYGDILEVLWGLLWYYESLFLRHTSPAFYPLIFYPEGWQVSTFGGGLGLYSLLLPLYLAGGAAFAYNALVVLSFFLAFAGTYKLARQFVAPFPATVAALLYTFWGLRWIRAVGHINILVSSALLPWLAWGMERAFTSGRRTLAWLVAVGALLGLAVSNNFYFVWIGSILVAGWAASRWLGRRIGWRTAVSGVAVPVLIALLLNAPVLFWLWQGTRASDATAFDIYHLSGWGASLNSLPLPNLFHPWFHALASQVFRGPATEAALVNLGLVGSLTAIVGAVLAWKSKRWQPVLLLAGVGLVLALGPTLTWNGQPVQVGALQPVNSAIWQVGYRLKPDLFVSAQPSAPLDTAVPLPSLVLSAVLPFWENARVASRYGLLGGLAVFMLSALALDRVRWRLPQVVLALLLLVEIVPTPLTGVPFPPQPHPALEWLKQQPEQGQSTLDLYAPLPHVLSLSLTGGENIWATRYSGQATASVVGSVWPPHTWYLYNYLIRLGNPFQSPDLAQVLREYGVRYILLHMRSDNEWQNLEQAKGNDEVRVVDCFSPPAGPSPWPYPICVVEVLLPSP